MSYGVKRSRCGLRPNLRFPFLGFNVKRLRIPLMHLHHLSLILTRNVLSFESILLRVSLILDLDLTKNPLSYKEPSPRLSFKNFVTRQAQLMKNLQIHASTLGADVIGLQDEKAGLAIFRGIPFASVSERWTQSMTQNTVTSPFDATNFGPKCPQPAHESIIPVAIPNPDPGEDEFKCLNLNITSPDDAVRNTNSKALLPVMVWIHG